MPVLRWFGKGFGLLMWVLSKRYRKHFEDNWLQAKKADEKGRMEKCSILKAVGNSGEIFFERRQHTGILEGKNKALIGNQLINKNN